jgi:hypothetical protein
MDSHDLTSAQAEKMGDALGPYLRYLNRVKRRMEARGFPMTDELFQATKAAYDAAHGLTVSLHYLSCKSGVGRPARSKEGDQDVECRSEPRGNH